MVFDYWENAISHFTIAVYTIAIRLACSGGDLAPLVGHNAFLRWSAMKECAFKDPRDGETKFWSENHVSEDFDLALRFQVRIICSRSTARYVSNHLCVQLVFVTVYVHTLAGEGIPRKICLIYRTKLPRRGVPDSS